MNGRQKRFDRLDLQLEAISDALAAAREEPSPERRGELLTVVERAFVAYREEHQAAMEERPRLRLLKGGAIAVALTGMGVWVREMWAAHQPIAVGTVAVATVIGAGALLFDLGPGAPDYEPPAARLTVTAQPSPGTPTPVPAETVTETMRPTGPAGPPADTSPTLREGPEPSAAGEPTLSPSASPARPGPADPSPSQPDRGGSTEVVPPPGLGDDEGSDGEGDQPQGRSCLLDIEVPGVDVEVGRLVCL